ncbi:Zinc finger protein klf1 [Cytospora mali]|uniref:Zinc finger protein klf1 n=1 Tax=Cytospora mali TaxID=578113 RepID=A0A194UTG5_CYTMA|nr:Zinc finger protein klf1 [Valsa mali var. pyri (nom. inval.)]
MISQVSPANDGRHPFPAPGSLSPETNRPGSGYVGPHPHHAQFQDAAASPYTPLTNTPPVFPHPNGARSNSANYMRPSPAYGAVSGHPPPHQSPNGPQRPSVQTNVGPYGVMSPASQHGFQGHPNSTPQSATPYSGQSNFPPFSLPPSNFASTASSATVTREGGQGYTPQQGMHEYPQVQPQTAGEMVLLDNMTSQTTIPVFGSDSVLNRSPNVGMPEDFMAYLFNTQAPDGTPMNRMAPPYNNYGDFANRYSSVPYYGTEPNQMGYFPTAEPQQVMAVNNLLDQNLPESVISEEKATEIFEFIKERFHENGRAPVEHKREGFIEGERTDEHMLSRKMMQAYIGSYWVHFSDQIPILHKPTFSPERTPTLLLISIISIGAACLDKAYGKRVTVAGAELSNFLAWHLRWETFMDSNFRPPAKLWVFQTLIHLELYEKMYSTRELHERAHIHHATTITLMRRGRSLIGKSALDSPPNPRDDKNGSRQSSASGVAHTPDEWWNHWITNEATRRAAFAAFIIDSIHATMFGHSTVMVAHEMRLPLPCDEKLWKAQSGAEVGRIEANLMSNGIKSIPFLEGLKRTLSSQEVQTNCFGRMILMAGLLNVSWHMNQRDLQVNSLGGGVSSALGGRDKWRGTLTKAFDHWKADFDKSLKWSGNPADPYRFDSSGRDDANVVFESRVVLHHLAHLAMHVDIVDCQIFARAKRLLGRAIGAQDLSSAQRRMKDIWAPSVRARDATWYALKFLCSVLLNQSGNPHTNGFNSQSHSDHELPYCARDDVLLNRPWVLYFAALVVWSYGHALEGPCPDVIIPNSQAERVQQMREYLQMYGGVDYPEELRTMKGLNNNSSLLLVLKDTFLSTRWELLHEGAMLLSNCVQLNSGTMI